MAFKAVDLSCIGFANGFTLWHYRTGDDMGDVCQSGYFNQGAYLRLRSGDIIFLHTGFGTAAAAFAQLVITQDDPDLGIVTQVLSAPDDTATHLGASCRRPTSAPLTLGLAAF